MPKLVIFNSLNQSKQWYFETEESFKTWAMKKHIFVSLTKFGYSIYLSEDDVMGIYTVQESVRFFVTHEDWNYTLVVYAKDYIHAEQITLRRVDKSIPKNELIYSKTYEEGSLVDLKTMHLIQKHGNNHE